MFALNTPESEILFELMLIANGHAESVLKLVSRGYGIYPQVLNALVASGEALLIDPIMRVAGELENYPVTEMQKWLEAYYEHNWKHQVIEFRLRKIAEVFFSYVEYIEAGFKITAVSVSCWEKIAKSDGIDLVKSIYVQKANELNQGSSLEAKEEVKAIEFFLVDAEEYEFLYERQCWRGLSHTLGGVRYIAQTKHYMNGLAECFLSYHDEMTPAIFGYCIIQLDQAQLDEHYRSRYAEWEKCHRGH